jgi:hypothetical protein
MLSLFWAASVNHTIHGSSTHSAKAISVRDGRLFFSLIERNRSLSHQLIFHKSAYEPWYLLIDHACGDVEQNHRRRG